MAFSDPRTPALFLLLLASACTDSDKIYASDLDAGEDASTGGGDAGLADTGSPSVACPDPSEAIDPTAVIDDLEDRNAFLSPIGGRSGGWWTAGDETPNATIVPARGGEALPELVPGGRCGSQYAMRVTGQGYMDWGSMLGMSFAYASTGTVSYDAGFREGITFWARVGDTSTNQVRFALSDVNSEPTGGICSEDGGLGQGCFDTFGVSLTGLDVVWKRFKIPFLGLSQRDFGLQVEALDSSQLYTVQFTFEPGAIFDLWVDDIAFY